MNITERNVLILFSLLHSISLIDLFLFRKIPTFFKEFDQMILRKFVDLSILSSLLSLLLSNMNGFLLRKTNIQKKNEQIQRNPFSDKKKSERISTFRMIDQ